MSAAPRHAEALRAAALARAGAYYAARFLGASRRSLGAVAQRTEQLSPWRRFRARRPFFDPAHLGRVRDTPSYSAAEIVREHLLRDTIEFRPVRAHWVEDAWLMDGSVFVRGTQRLDLRDTLRRTPAERISFRPAGECLELERAVLGATCAGATWFGHWLEDEVPLLLLGERHGESVAPARRAYAHEAGYLRAFGLRAPRRAGVARVGELVVIEEFAQNPHKTARYAELRARLAGPPGARRVFLARGGAGQPRTLVNEHALCERFAREGFRVLDVSRAAFGELAATLRGAEVIAGVEGSHLAHALYLAQDHASLLILNPPDRVHTTVADIGVFCRLHSGMFVCEPDPAGRGFLADAEEALAFLERLLAHAAAERATLGAYVDELLALNGAPRC